MRELSLTDYSKPNEAVRLFRAGGQTGVFFLDSTGASGRRVIVLFHGFVPSVLDRVTLHVLFDRPVWRVPQSRYAAEEHSIFEFIRRKERLRSFGISEIAGKRTVGAKFHDGRRCAQLLRELE